MSYWITVEYLGAGFVLQRKHNSDGVITAYDNKVRRRYAKERIIHVEDTDSIDTSTIDVERLK